MLKRYQSLVELLKTIVPSNVEVVLHDIENLDESIIAIVNGHVSGRHVGAPATDFTLKVLSDVELQKNTVIDGYQTTSKSGVTLKSSTYLLKNDQDQLIGLLCFNIDTTAIDKIKNDIDNLFAEQLAFTSDNFKGMIDENFMFDKKELRYQAIQNTIDNYPVKKCDMTSYDRFRITEMLYDSGTFIMKGSVNEVAEMLDVSPATLYRYIKRIENPDKK